jgi:TatD DNase family protein
MYIDTHCHLNLAEFEGQTKEVIDRAKSAQVNSIVVPGIDLETSLIAFQMAKNDPTIHAAAGIHPNNIQNASLQNIDELTKLIPRNEIVAVGEIGLDYYRHQEMGSQQLQIFEQLLSIACQEAKPVIIHSRSAVDDTLSMLNLFKPEGLRGVWHCFEGDLELATKLLDLGFLLGFTGNITYNPDDESIIEVIKNIPNDRILIETDAPYLAPIPHRGQQNEPAFVVEVARRIADIKGLTIEEVASITSANAIKLFNL